MAAPPSVNSSSALDALQEALGRRRDEHDHNCQNTFNHVSCSILLTYEGCPPFSPIPRVLFLVLGFCPFSSIFASH
eukprot:755602-Hanusia_phi.AAC.4